MSHSIAEFTKNLTPQQRSENARKAALAGHKKRKEKKQEKNRIKKVSAEELDDFLGELKFESGNAVPKKFSLTSIYDPFLDKFRVGQNVYFNNQEYVTRIYNASKDYGKKSNKTFTLKTELKDGKKRFGLWRIK